MADITSLEEQLGFPISYTPNVISKQIKVISAGLTRLDQIGWDDLPDNVYLNKQTCGCGATHLAITNNVDYVIASPYIRLIDNKCESHSNIIPVHGDISDKRIKESYQNKIDLGIPVKFMTTYEGLSRLLSYDWFIPSMFKLMVDEAHDLVNFGLFRKEAVGNLILNYKKFKSFVFVTATPNKEQFLPSSLTNIDHLELDWKSANVVNIDIQKARKNGNDFIVETCRSYLHNERDGNAHIFYNSVKEILAVVRALKKLPSYSPESIKIVCANTDYNIRSINREGAGMYSTSLLQPRKLNFYTSCVFEGADIYDSVGRTYIVVNASRNSSKICMTTLVPQICGRIRDSQYNSNIKMLVCGSIDCLEYKRTDWFKEVVKKALQAKSAVSAYEYAKSLPNNEKLLKGYRNDALYDPYLLLDDNNDVVQNEGAIQAEMQRYDIIHSQYKVLSNSEHVNEEMKENSLYETNIVGDAFKPLTGSYKVAVDKVANFKDLIKEYINAHKQEDAVKLEFLTKTHPMLSKYFDTLGEAKIKALNYGKKAVDKEYSLCLYKEDKHFEVVELCLKEFKIGDIIFCSAAKDIIHFIYMKLGISEKVSATTFTKYFNVKQCQRLQSEKKQRAYKIESIVDLNLLT